MSFDVQKIRKDFPNLKVNVKGQPITYLDNAATTFKPKSVITAVHEYYTTGTANVHRGLHELSEKATAQFEATRETIKRFINAQKISEIILTKGATEGINLVMNSYGRAFLKKGDEILVSEMEHHSNIVPWQMLCEEKGCHLKIIPINDNGELDIEQFHKLLNKRIKLISVVYVSNSLGTVNPIQTIIQEAHRFKIPVLIDGAQAVSHFPIDVQTLDCDFFVFSGHKLFGPTGVGVLYGKEELLNKMPPYQGGGDMIERVSFEKTTYNILPHKFEAGTPNIAGVIGLKPAIEYLQSIGFAAIMAHEEKLLAYGTQVLKKIKGLRIIGNARKKVPVFSFDLKGIHAQDIGTLVNEEGVAIRTGHHCTMPVMQHFGLKATSRAALAFYNTKEDIDHLVHALGSVKKIFA